MTANSELKATPGPWVASDNHSTVGLVWRVETRGHSKGWVIAHCHGPDAEANAHLIAEAPSLYAALAYARNLIGPDEIIDAALSRARGNHD